MSKRLGQTNRAVVLIASTAAVCGLLFGYDTGVISGALLFLKKDFALSAFEQGIVTSAVLVGATLGAGFSGHLADRFGRRRMVIALAVLFFIASLVTGLAPTVAWLIFGRILVGIAIGVCSYTGPLYISEISPAESRGSLVSLNQLLITVGILVSYLADFLLAGGEHWRWMFGLAAIPSVVLAVGMLLLPESPRWLVYKGRPDLAEKVLRRVLPEEDINRELAAITSLASEGNGHPATSSRNTAGWAELLSAENRPALIVGVGLAMFQQITGINTIIYYAPTIFQLAHIGSAAQAILATAGVGAVNVLMTVISIRLIDRVGRRPLLLTGISGMIASLAVLGAVFSLSSSASSLGWLAVVSMMLYVGSFAISLGPIFWLLISEIYPQRVRNLAMGVATMANWGFNLIVALTFLSLVESLGANWTFWLYAVISIASLLFCYRRVPETKGRVLEEIHDAWRTNARPGAAV
jgi:SP family galactose:H+ symporter-like MFS transporter